MARSPEEELHWWYGSMPGELGQHGSGFEGGATTWDAQAIWRLLESKINPEVARAVRHYAAVLPVMQALGPMRRELAAVLYEPHSTPDRYAHLDALWRPITRVSALAAVTRTPAIRNAFARGHGGQSETSPAVLLEWASEAIRPRVEKGRATNQAPPRWAAVALEEAHELHAWLIEQYAEAKGAIEKAHHDEDRAEVARLRKVFDLEARP